MRMHKNELTNTNFKAMKKLVLVLIGAILIFQCQAGGTPKKGGDQQKNATEKGSFTITSTPDLQDLASSWASEYSANNPGTEINRVNGTDQESDLAFVTDEYLKSNERSGWKMVIGRDAIVPIISSANPYLNEIVRQGVSAKDFSATIKNLENRTWATMIDGVKGGSANLYLIENESIKLTIAAFTGLSTASVIGTTASDGKAMIQAIQNDPNGFGFCKLSDITDETGEKLLSGIALLPIDKNANGTMDYVEKIYGNVADLSRGMWIGKYPKTLCRNLYVISPVTPVEESEVAFLKYILTSGQGFIGANGFNILSKSERISKIDRLPITFIPTQAANGINVLQLVITILAGLAIVISLIVLFVRFKKANHPMAKHMNQDNHRVITDETVTHPKGLYFDKGHTWTFMERDGTVKVGIDDFLQHVTGKITSIKMKKPGEKVIKGEKIMTIIQKGKRLNISAPVSGIILADNTNLLTNSFLINESPYGEGWIYKIEPTNWTRENQFLLMAEKYSEWLSGEFTRLKDFLAHAVKPNDPPYAYIILQDGGEITDNVMENLPPEVWEDFQNQFIDNSK
jgi:glycine cleavage system H lipoate-binding protein/ABC-type phosphate transport system substrate-binding protein